MKKGICLPSGEGFPPVFRDMNTSDSDQWIECVRFFSEDVLQEKGRLKKDVVWTAIKVHFILKGIQNGQIRTPLETIEIYCLTRPMGGGSGDCRLRWRRFFFSLLLICTTTSHFRHFWMPSLNSCLVQCLSMFRLLCCCC